MKRMPWCLTKVIDFDPEKLWKGRPVWVEGKVEEKEVSGYYLVKESDSGVLRLQGVDEELKITPLHVWPEWYTASGKVTIIPVSGAKKIDQNENPA